MANDTIHSKHSRQFQFNAWDIEVKLDNLSGKKLDLNTEAILELVIYDDLISWPYKGYITINNMHEAFERKGSPSDDQVIKDLEGTESIPSDPNVYLFRMDGHDEIYIKIAPIPDPEDDQTLPEKIWTFENTYTIYDTQDMPTPNALTKRKRLYFWDKKYQLLQEKNIEWSTAKAKTNTNYHNTSILPAHATDEARSMFTGDALKDLLIEAGFEDNISKNIPKDENINFDKGGTKILYNSPTQNTINDDIDHILNSHLWTDTSTGNAAGGSNDICIFHLDRHTKKWTLKPLHQYFKLAGSEEDKPGPLQIEHLFFEGHADDKKISPYKAPILNDVDLGRDIKISQWNKIDSYQFVDMAGIDNVKALVSKPVHQYDFKNKQFIMDFEDNEIERVRDDFNQLYIKDKLLGGSGGPSPLFTINKIKKEQLSIQHRFNSSNISDKASRILSGKGEILYAAIFLNECIVVRLMGSTHRLSGTFIGIDRQNVDSDNDFDYKICGQWFVINVKHVIYKNTYMNELTAVKIHSYEKLDIDEDNVLIDNSGNSI